MTQSSWSAIVDRVEAQMLTVASIGKVHDYQRYVLGEVKLDSIGISAIGGEDRFRVWMITLGRMDTKPEDQAGDMQWNRLIQIDGYVQIEDANTSEQTTIALAESVIRTLWNDVRTTRFNNTVLFGKPGQIVSLVPEFFSMVACHHVRITMPIQTLDSPT